MGLEGCWRPTSTCSVPRLENNRDKEGDMRWMSQGIHMGAIWLSSPLSSSRLNISMWIPTSIIYHRVQSNLSLPCQILLPLLCFLYFRFIIAIECHTQTRDLTSGMTSRFTLDYQLQSVCNGCLVHCAEEASEVQSCLRGKGFHG